MIPPPSSLAEFEQLLAAAVDPVALPSICFGVSRGTETLLATAKGSETTQTAFALASVTKPMTTTALMLLARRGLVDLDKPINDYLGGEKLRPGEPTVRQVADHSSGLHTYFRFYYADEPFRRAPFGEVVERYGLTFTAPGERYHYSNLGYGLLDYVISRVSGKPYAQFMAEEVFAPLAMADSFIGPPGDRPHAASFGPDGVPYPQYDFDHPGGSAAYASIGDLLRFGQFHLSLGPNYLSEAELRSMQRASSHIDETRGYGLGWGVNIDRLGMLLVQHTGSMGGVSSILRLVPELDLVIAGVANGETQHIWRAADDALATIVPAFRERLIDERAQGPQATTVEPLPAELMGTWRGAIRTNEGDRLFELNIDSPQCASARLNGMNHPVEELQMREGRLLGVFDGDIATADAARRPYRIHFDLAVEPGKLRGAALTLNKPVEGGGGAPHRRMGSALPYWTELLEG